MKRMVPILLATLVFYFLAAPQVYAVWVPSSELEKTDVLPKDLDQFPHPLIERLTQDEQNLALVVEQLRHDEEIIKKLVDDLRKNRHRIRS